jgi:hypothetical protein
MAAATEYDMCDVKTMANHYYSDALLRILDAEHVIDYTSSWTMPEEIAKITQEIAGKLTNDASNDRLTQSFRPDEGLARIVADARSIAEQRRGDANVNPDAARGNSAPQSPPPAWRPPVGRGDQGALFSLRDDGRDPAERKRNVQNLHLALTTPSRAGASKIRAIADNAKAIFSPTSLAGAKPTEHVVRRNAAQQAASYARTVADLSDLRDAMNALPVDEQHAFTARMEKGERQPTPELQAISDMLRASYDGWTKRIQSLCINLATCSKGSFLIHISDACYRHDLRIRPSLDGRPGPRQPGGAA